jgi:hypothetical protein
MKIRSVIGVDPRTSDRIYSGQKKKKKRSADRLHALLWLFGRSRLVDRGITARPQMGSFAQRAGPSAWELMPKV